MRAAPPGLVPAAAGAVAAILLATATNTASGVFGVLDNTADELADLLGVDEVPEFAAQAVRLARPAYEPLKMVSASCTEALFPEFNDVNDMNDCLLLHQRVLWRGRQRPLLVRQTMSKDTKWSSSTGSAIWGGGVVLQRYMELLGSDFWAGKRVLELGTGTGVGSISAAKLGAAEVVATDRDAAVLELAAQNAASNLGRLNGVFRTAELTWGKAPSSPAAAAVEEAPWDIVIGADLTYNREAWPALADELRRLRTPALLSATERQPNELRDLLSFLEANGFVAKTMDSPTRAGAYSSTKVRLLSIDAYQGEPSPPGPAK